MKVWRQPELNQLGVEQTKQGDKGGDADGVVYDVEYGSGRTGVLIGTSGDAIDEPGVTPR